MGNRPNNKPLTGIPFKFVYLVPCGRGQIVWLDKITYTYFFGTWGPCPRRISDLASPACKMQRQTFPVQSIRVSAQRSALSSGPAHRIYSHVATLRTPLQLETGISTPLSLLVILEICCGKRYWKTVYGADVRVVWLLRSTKLVSRQDSDIQRSTLDSRLWSKLNRSWKKVNQTPSPSL